MEKAKIASISPKAYFSEAVFREAYLSDRRKLYFSEAYLSDRRKLFFSEAFKKEKP